MDVIWPEGMTKSMPRNTSTSPNDFRMFSATMMGSPRFMLEIYAKSARNAPVLP